MKVTLLLTWRESRRSYTGGQFSYWHNGKELTRHGKSYVALRKALRILREREGIGMNEVTTAATRRADYYRGIYEEGRRA